MYDSILLLVHDSCLFMMLVGIGFYQWSLNPITFRTQCGRSDDDDDGGDDDDDDDGQADHDFFFVHDACGYRFLPMELKFHNLPKSVWSLGA